MNSSNFEAWAALAFIIVVVLFMTFGESVGWRAAGIVQLVFSIQVLRRREVPVGVEEQEPSFIAKGPVAILLGIVSLGLSVMLLFFPEQTVMR